MTTLVKLKVTLNSIQGLPRTAVVVLLRNDISVEDAKSSLA